MRSRHLRINKQHHINNFRSYRFIISCIGRPDNENYYAVDRPNDYCLIFNVTDFNIAQLAERLSLAGELTLSCTRPAADG